MSLSAISDILHRSKKANVFANKPRQRQSQTSRLSQLSGAQRRALVANRGTLEGR
jgi:hypothetical protein